MNFPVYLGYVYCEYGHLEYPLRSMFRQSSYVRGDIKGKLVHNFMTFYFVFISCLLDMNKKSTTEKQRKKNIYGS